MIRGVRIPPLSSEALAKVDVQNLRALWRFPKYCSRGRESALTEFSADRAEKDGADSRRRLRIYLNRLCPLASSCPALALAAADALIPSL